MSTIMLFLWLLSFCAAVSAFWYPFSAIFPGTKFQGNGCNDKGLFLTPYIEAGQFHQARSLAEVEPFEGNITSYSGFLTVNKTCQSNLFFWLFPAENKYSGAPIIVWLQGGPGATSLYGLFNELGPYELTLENKLSLRKYSWNREATIIFIDNPVGTGYSFTKRDECYAKDEEDVGRDLLTAFKQILQLFPEYNLNSIFITGESYAGKYVPAFSYAILKDRDPKFLINLKGLAIGNGLVDPYNQLHYSEYLYQLGLIDNHEKYEIKKQEDNCRCYISINKWEEAFSCFDNLINGDFTQRATYFQNFTGYQYYYNFLHAQSPPEGDLTTFITKAETRKKIHVGNAVWNDGKKVQYHLKKDVMKSIRPWLEELLEHYKVLIYNGQLDIVVGYPLTEKYLKTLIWSEEILYKKAKRHIWRVDNEVAGYVKTAGKLTEVLVRNAGHMVPKDQPKWAFDMIHRFIKNKPFY